ncbi:MAG: DUF6583 family protein, partial [Lysinibacillus sp.]
MKGKIVPIIISVLVLVVGGIATASFLLKKSPKEQYFLAEIDTAKNSIELFKERYEDEFQWAEVVKEKPTAHTLDLSAEYEGQGIGTENEMISNILSGTSVSIDVATDPAKKVVEAKLSGSIMDVPLDEIKGYVTAEKIMLDFPFSEKNIQLKDKELGKLMLNLDEYYTGSEELGLADLFDNPSLLTEAQEKYLLDAYVMYVFKELPEEAFTVEKETIKVHGESLKANQVTMKLSAKEMQGLLVKVLEKAKSDEKLKDIIEDILKKYGGTEKDLALEMFEESYEEEMNNAIEELKSTELKGSVKSVIWTADNQIVKRDLKFTEGKESSLVIKGTQLLNKDQQQFSYDFSDGYTTVTLKGDLTSKDGKIADSISLSDGSGIGVTYEGDETLKKGVRTFERKLSLNEGSDEYFISWDG